MLPSSVGEGMPWSQAMVGVVRPARVSNHPALASANTTPLIQGGDFSRRTVYLCGSVSNSMWSITPMTAISMGENGRPTEVMADHPSWVSKT